MKENDDSDSKESELEIQQEKTGSDRDRSVIGFFAKYKWRIILTALIIFALVMLCVASQVAQAVEFFKPGAGKYVISILFGIFVLPFLYQAIKKLCKLDPPLVPPDPGSSDDEKLKFRKRQLKRLRENKKLLENKGITKTTEEIDEILKNRSGSTLKEYDEITGKAFNELDEEAKKIVRRSARKIGFQTGLSQWGAMDAFIVAVNQIGMVLELARLYYTRPKLIEIVKLYVFVGGNAFFAFKVEGWLKKGIDSLADLLPVIRIVASSVTNGLVHYLLARRIGHIAIQYCRSGCVPDKKKLIDKARSKTREWHKEWKKEKKIDPTMLGEGQG